jgi:hypothetical protein
MDDGFPHRGDISRAFIRACHHAISDVVDGASDAFHELRSQGRPEYEDWVIEQPRAQRSYLRSIEKMGRVISLVMFTNGLDHALLLKDALDSPRNALRIWSYLSLARGCLEAMTRTAYVCDRTTPPNQVLLRAAAVDIDGLQEQVKMAREFTDVEVGMAKHALDRKIAKCVRAGIEIIYGKDEKSVARLRRGADVVNVTINVSAESAKRVPDIPGPYRFGSAAAHSGAWFLMHAVLGEDEFSPAADPDIVLTAVSLTIWPLVAVVHSVEQPGVSMSSDRLHRLAASLWSRAHVIRLRDHR